MVRNTRPISWIKAARKDFEKFPKGAREHVLQALTIAAETGLKEKPTMMQPIASDPNITARPTHMKATSRIFSIRLSAGFDDCADAVVPAASKIAAIAAANWSRGPLVP